MKKSKRFHQKAMLSAIRLYMNNDRMQLTPSVLSSVERRLGLNKFRIRLGTKHVFWDRVERINKALERKAPHVIFAVWRGIVPIPSLREPLRRLPKKTGKRAIVHQREFA